MKKLLLILFLFVAMFLVACTETSEPTVVETEDKPENEATEETSSEANEEVKTEFNLGETIELDGAVLTVTNVEKSQGSEFDSPKEGNEYVIVHVKIENSGDENLAYNPFDFTLKNSNGQITDTAFALVSQETDITSGELAAGGTVEGTIPFEAPVGDTALQLIYTPNWWFDSENITVNLQ